MNDAFDLDRRRGAAALLADLLHSHTLRSNPRAVPVFFVVSHSAVMVCG